MTSLKPVQLILAQRKLAIVERRHPPVAVSSAVATIESSSHPEVQKKYAVKVMANPSLSNIISTGDDPGLDAELDKIANPPRPVAPHHGPRAYTMNEAPRTGKPNSSWPPNSSAKLTSEPQP